MNIVWFKRDLRLLDHAPLARAIELGQPLLLLYIVEPALLKDPHYRDFNFNIIFDSPSHVSKAFRIVPCFFYC